MEIYTGASCEEDYYSRRAYVFLQKVEEEWQLFRLVIKHLVIILEVWRYLRYVLDLCIKVLFVRIKSVKFLNSYGVVLLVISTRKYTILILGSDLNEIRIPHASLDQAL